VVLAGFERFFALFIEHFAGHFPLWVAPTQAVVIPVSEPLHRYGSWVHRQLTEAGIRSALDDRSETVSHKVRDAEKQHVPLILVVGKREEAAQSVTLRRAGRQCTLPVSQLVEQSLQEIREKRLPPRAETNSNK